MDEEDAGFASDLLKYKLSSVNRSSDLSFKCSGQPEPLFSDEAAWLRSPLTYQRRKKRAKMELGKKSLPAKHTRRESWVKLAD